ncbi:Uncharacterised protein [Mycobacteroides abscessus subsp. abscessus]|nr:Uncharacterised protein [Mycobacteroides abscessus subsp. abscessus]
MQILTLRGTTERPGPGSLLASLTPQLDPGIVVHDVDYPAAIGPANPDHNPLGGVSLYDSVEAGVAEIARLVARADEPVGLVGYSLGAMAISRYLERCRSGWITAGFDANRIAFVGLVANPLRAEGDSIDGKAHGWGIAGQHGPWPVLPVFEIANPGDMITACPANSPLRYLADSLTFASATDLGLWKADIMSRLRTGNWQLAGARPPLRDYAAAVTGLWGYLFGGQHVGAYTRPDGSGVSMLGRLAGLINEQARTRRAAAG